MEFEYIGTKWNGHMPIRSLYRTDVLRWEEIENVIKRGQKEKLLELLIKQ